MEIHIGDRVAEIELVSKEDNKVVLTIDGKPFEADVVMAENGTCNILMDGRSANAQLIRRENGKSYKVNTHYSSFNVEIVDSQAKYLRMRKKGEEEQNDCIISPMPGKVVKIPVAVGQEMKSGDTAIVFKTTNRNYTIIFITHNENGIISYFPTCCAVFTGIRLPPYLSKLVNMIPRQKAINIGFTHFCDCRQSGKIVVAFVIVVSIKPRRYTYRKNQDDYSYNR